MKLLKKIKPRIQFKKPEQSDTWSCYYCKSTVDNGDKHLCMERYFREAKGRAPKRDK